MVELEVQDMTCGGCANSVRRSIQAVDDKANVEVDLASKKVTVESRATLDQLRAAVEGAGFPVTAGVIV